MFSGIIEDVGLVGSIDHSENGCRLRITTKLAQAFKEGESIAVDGVCLTITETGLKDFSADVSTETLRRTTFPNLHLGDPVNLERPLVTGARLGGHFVLGHVDGIGIIRSLRQEADTKFFEIGYPKQLSSYFVEKGSVSVNGISLTIAGLNAGSFEVAIIPYTLDNTNMRFLGLATSVNLECDVLGKYVHSLLAKSSLLPTSQD